MLVNKKPLRPDSRIVQSLLNLKSELEPQEWDPSTRVLLFKINSCLYDEYPPRFKTIEKG